ncbi:hypothetical protein [Pseudoalteromonas sp. BSi20652]|uniref:hypothetical protein n=1 Tax=Pseudoalteromonas sp. BSi20652 TaxID=388384 RepID=UPI001305230D|nr:hypothetical protein [Pseudoalteromonas sp. BSi20652]
MLEMKATLRISSKSLTLDHLVQYLGEPTRGFSIGDEFSLGKKEEIFLIGLGNYCQRSE